MKTKLIVSIIFLSGLVTLACKPGIPPYPYIGVNELNAKAQKMSDDLTAYIKDWSAGKVPSKLPDSLYPDGARGCKWWNQGFYLKNPDTLAAEDMLLSRQAHDSIDFNMLYGLCPDRHYTYIMPSTCYAPFGATYTLKGQFPHCRFFSVQVAPPFDGRFYNWLGVGEVLLMDVDINPDSGHVNPFRVGANRNSTNRNYTVTIKMAKGDAIALNGSAHTPPYYRGTGNTRFGSGIVYQGPWQDPNYTDATYAGAKEGAWMWGKVWLRYGRIDRGYDWKAGVPLPKSSMQLATGEKFWVWHDPVWAAKHANQAMVQPNKNPADPDSAHDADDGWDAMFGIIHGITASMYRAQGLNSESDKLDCRKTILGVTGMGESQPGIGHIKPSESCANLCDYLGRDITIGSGKVACIAGKLPTFPDTRGADAAIMAGGKQMRYFSITSYMYDLGADANYAQGASFTSICDDEIVLDANRNYIICYSRPENKPVNALSANGVTWVNWGTADTGSTVIRWISVYPDWYFDKTPNEVRLPWAKVCWDASKYDKSLLCNNDRNGFLKEYHPMIYYMNKTSFEGLGKPITEAKLKTVSWGCGSSLSGGIISKLAVCIPLFIAIGFSVAWFFNRRSMSMDC